MSMFTDEQKQRAWARLRSGRSASGDAYLIHIMSIAGGQIRMYRENFPEAVHRLAITQRLVRRGLIVTIDEFNRAYSFLQRDESR